MARGTGKYNTPWRMSCKRRLLENPWGIALVYLLQFRRSWFGAWRRSPNAATSERMYRGSQCSPSPVGRPPAWGIRSRTGTERWLARARGDRLYPQQRPLADWADQRPRYRLISL